MLILFEIKSNYRTNKNLEVLKPEIYFYVLNYNRSINWELFAAAR